MLFIRMASHDILVDLYNLIISPGNNFDESI